MIDLLDRLIRPTAAYINDRIQGYVATAQTTLKAFAVGDVSTQVLQAVSFTIELFGSIVTDLTRSSFGETAMDPGDDPNDPNPDYSAPKWLSYWGEGLHGAKRRGKSFAIGFVTLSNASNGQTQTIAPFALTFTRSTLAADNSQPTYKNEADPSIYAGAGGTFDLQPGQTRTIPIVADVIGTGSNASAGEISILTSTLLGVTVTNAADVRGSDGEERFAYVRRARKAAAPTSPGGPAEAVEYLATTLPGGDPLLNSAGAPVGITKVYVSRDSTTGNVDVYYGSPAGAADALDVIAANLNIIKYGVPDTVVFGPSASPVGGITAVNTMINVVYTAKIKSFPGVDTTAINNDVTAKLGEFFPTDIGGFDSVLGSGVVYTVDLAGEIKATRSALNKGTKWGLYDIVIITPAGATWPVALGEIAVLGGVSGTITVVP